MNESSARFVLRAVGIAIAIAAIVDPAITTRRAVRPVVQLIAADSARDARLVDRVARAIDERFTVARSPIAGASATIVVGDRIPRAAAETPGPAFVVARDSTLPSAARAC